MSVTLAARVATPETGAVRRSGSSTGSVAPSPATGSAAAGSCSASRHRLRARRRPGALHAASRHRLRQRVRRRRVVRAGLDRVLLHDQQRRQHLPPGLLRGRVVAHRRLALLLRACPLHHRLQPLPRRLLLVPLRHRDLRPAPRLLQQLPLRPVQHPDPRRHRGRLPGRDLHGALGLGPFLQPHRARRQPHPLPQRAVPAGAQRHRRSTSATRTSGRPGRSSGPRPPPSGTAPTGGATAATPTAASTGARRPAPSRSTAGWTRRTATCGPPRDRSATRRPRSAASATAGAW
jgi:hypothetical protein